MLNKCLCLFLSCLILTACGGSVGTPVSSAPIGSNENIPTESTAAPTELNPNQKPNLTPKPFPAWVENNIGNVKVEFGDDYNSLGDGYLYSENVTLSNGTLTLEKPNPSEGFGTYWINDYPLKTGRAVLIRFRYSPESDFNIGFSSGEYGTPDFRWIGVDDDAVVGGKEGTISLDRFPISEDFPTLVPDRWLDLLMAIDEGGDFLIQIGPGDQPDNNLTTRVHYRDDWGNLSWKFGVFLTTGKITLDRFDYLSFNDFPDVPIPQSIQTCSGQGNFPQRLHVEGNQIVNEDGESVILRGVAIVDPVIAAKNYDTGTPNLDDSFKIIHEWGANLVRIPVHPLMWRHAGIAEYLRILDQSVELACRYQLYVLLDYHSIGFPPYDVYTPGDDLVRTTRQEIQEFWHVAGARYAENDVVALYELFNEPVVSLSQYQVSPGDWQVWKTYLEELIDQVRISAPNKTIVVGGLNYAAYLEYVPQHPVERENLAYSVHPYPGSYPDASGWETNIGNIKKSYPVIATEFGFEPTSTFHWSETNHYGLQLYRYEIIDYLESHNVSWAVWVLSSSWGPPLLKADFSPSEAGEYFKQRLLELN